MSGHFVKLYGTILTSSVWVESTTTRIVWITLLALADKDGFVSAAVPGLAHIANVSLADCEAALRVLEGPDVHSRTPEHDGRRIERIEGGWNVLNRNKYRDLRTEHQISEAERVKKYREKTQPVRVPYVRTEVEVEKETTTTKALFAYPPEFELVWKVLPKKPGANKAQTYTLYCMHLKNGIDYDVIYSGAKAYAAYAIHEGWIGTKWVKAPQVFMGKDKHFLSDWTIPAPASDLVGVGGEITEAELRRAGIRLA